MVKRLRLTPNQRGEALFLLDKGFTVSQAAKTLQEIRHPDRPLEVVKKAYFPPNAHGPVAIQNLQGKSSEEIAGRYFKLGDFLESRSRWMGKLNQNPAVRKRADRSLKRFWKSPRSTEARKAARRRLAMRMEDSAFFAKVVGALKRANDDPEFRARAAQRARGISSRFWKTATPERKKSLAKLFRERMLRQKRDPKFVKRQREAHSRFWEEYRQQRAAEARAAIGAVAEQPGGWEGRTSKLRKSVPVHIPDIEKTIHDWRALTRALSNLDPLQRFVLSHTFGIEMQHNSEVVQKASKLSKGEWQSEVDAAYEQLQRSKRLKKLLGE